jgi:hypothetical protein
MPNKGLFQPGDIVIHRVTGTPVLILEYFHHEKYAYKVRRYNTKTGLLEELFCYEVELEKEKDGEENKKISPTVSKENEQVEESKEKKEIGEKPCLDVDYAML